MTNISQIQGITIIHTRVPLSINNVRKYRKFWGTPKKLNESLMMEVLWQANSEVYSFTKSYCLDKRCSKKNKKSISKTKTPTIISLFAHWKNLGDFNYIYKLTFLICVRITVKNYIENKWKLPKPTQGTANLLYHAITPNTNLNRKRSMK